MWFVHMLPANGRPPRHWQMLHMLAEFLWMSVEPRTDQLMLETPPRTSDALHMPGNCLAKLNGRILSGNSARGEAPINSRSTWVSCQSSGFLSLIYYPEFPSFDWRSPKMFSRLKNHHILEATSAASHYSHRSAKTGYSCER